MVRILNTDEINTWITTICEDSRKYLVIISPYLKINDKLRRTIEASLHRGVKLTIIYGKSELERDTYDWLKSLPYCNLGFIENLHAKLLLNEEAALMSSMNLYEYSQVNNEELGMLAWIKESRNEYKDLLYESVRLINCSTKQFGKWDLEGIDKPLLGLVNKEKFFIPVEKTCEEQYPEEPVTQDEPVLKRQICHCIRCGHAIPSDYEFVYCGRCLESWKRYSNPRYIENTGHCYICGKEWKTSAEKPACPDCYLSNQKLIKIKCKIMTDSVFKNSNDSH